MTRTIKFRGKDIKTGEWVYGDVLHAQNYDPNTRTATKSENLLIVTGEVGERSYVADILPSTVGQFTGLQDSKGQDIYEGDILKDKDWELFEDKYSFVVSFDEISPRFLCGRTDGRGSNYQLDATFANRSVIIANIHNNPELLKGGEKWL